MSTVRLIPKKSLSSKILLIEDDLAFQESLKKILSREGYEVFTVDNGEDALEILKQDTFNIVITDIYLGCSGKVHGFDILDALYQREKPIPIIVLSAFGDCGDYMDTAMKKGASLFLSKPVKKEVLLKAIQETLFPHP
ncbi:MAG: response regulator [Planctomycetota bacterium]